MPPVPLDPEDEGKASDKEETQQFQRPEFVVIDERDGQTRCTYFGANGSQSTHQSIPEGQEQFSSIKGAIFLRLVSLFGLVFCLVLGLGLLLWSLLLTLLATVFLFQHSTFNQSVRYFWKLLFVIVMLAFCFTVGLISPALAFGLAVFFFSLSSQENGKDFLYRILNPNSK